MSKKEIPGNFIARHISLFVITEEILSKGSGINYDRLSQIINGRIQDGQQ